MKVCEKYQDTSYIETDDRRSVVRVEDRGGGPCVWKEQIEATLDRLIVSPSVETSSVNGRIVLTKGRTPKLRYSRETSLLKKFIRLNGTLRSGARVLEEKISG